MDAAGGLWIELIVPVLLLVVMTSMGLELTPADFRRVARLPKPTLVGLAGQMLWLPCLGLGFAFASGLRPELALGIVIITACPGGAPSNIFTYLGGANIALSITLTALSSLLTFLTIPLWVNLGLSLFFGESSELRLPLLPTFAQLFVVTILPVGLGMTLRARWPDRVQRLRPRVKQLMVLLFLAATVLIVWSEWEVVIRDFPEAAPASLVLVSLALATAFAFARLADCSAADAFTISVEVGLQNGALAIMIIVNLLGRPELMVFPGTYALLAFGPVGLWTVAYRLRGTP